MALLLYHQLIKMYYRSVSRTSLALLYWQTRELFEDHLTKKMPNKFDHNLWKHMISETIHAQQLIDVFVDFLLLGRKQKEMMLLPHDKDRTTSSEEEILSRDILDDRRYRYAGAKTTLVGITTSELHDKSNPCRQSLCSTCNPSNTIIKRGYLCAGMEFSWWFICHFLLARTTGTSTTCSQKFTFWALE